jgi:glutathione S-transferase
VKVTLYVIPGSHPGMAARLMLERKGIPYRRIDLLPALSRRLIKLFGFSGDRTPGMKVDGRKVQGSIAIARELDRLQPDPPLYPTDPQQRAAVEEAERWGDEVLQELPRKIAWWALKRRKGDQTSFLKDARLVLPTRLLVATSGPVVSMAARLNNSTDEVVRETVAAIPAAIDRIDALIAEGVLNGDELNAADYQVGTSVRLLMSFDDIAPMIDGRPAGELAKRVQPQATGRIGPVVPAEWLQSAAAPAPSTR